MIRVLSVIAISFLLLAPASLAYGEFEPVNDAQDDAASEARAVVESRLTWAVYGFYGNDGFDLVFDGRHYKVNFTDNRTWIVYNDADDDYRQDHNEAEKNVTAIPVVLVQVHGNATTDHVLVMVLPLHLRAGVCPHDAAAGAADGLARGARCNGDLDRDGREDFSEIERGQNPLGDDPAPLPLP